MRTLVKAIAFSLALLASSSGYGAIIFHEDFSGGSPGLEASVNPSWADDDPEAFFEVYGPANAWERDMLATYDHDNNGATAAIPIPGAAELNVSQGSISLTATLVLGVPILPNELAELSFWAGLRGPLPPTIDPTVEIFNVTTATTITGVINPNVPGGAAPTREWTYNSFTFPSSAAALGDTLEFRFFGGPNHGGQGLQLADVTLRTIPVPEPGTMALLLVSIGSLIGIRHYRRS